MARPAQACQTQEDVVQLKAYKTVMTQRNQGKEASGMVTGQRIITIYMGKVVTKTDPAKMWSMQPVMSANGFQ